MMLVAPFVALVLVSQASPSPEPMPDWVRVQEGKDARIDCVTPAGQLGSTPIWRLMEEAMAAMVEHADRVQARKSDDPENVVLLGHNTPAKVLRLYAWKDHLGRLHAIAQVKIGGGTLQGEDFWVSAGRLRLDGEAGGR